LKQVALEVADEVSPLAAAVGAANTLLLDGGRRADNTDVAGIVGALREAGLTAADSAVVLGPGGTAQAALAALRELGVAEPTPLARSAAAAGCTVVSGLALLLHQAVGQVRLMTGLEPPVEAMRAALPR